MLVIGAGPGLGASVPQRFAREGYGIILGARRQEALDAYTEHLFYQGINAHSVVIDAADPNSIDRAVSHIHNHFGKVDVLFYNAAVTEGGKATSIDNETLARNFQVNVGSALAAVRALLPNLEESRGGVLFTGGGLALHPKMEYASVSVTKAALRNLAYVLHEELEPRGVFVGTVTIAGFMDKTTNIDQTQVAELFWDLYCQRGACERIYTTGRRV